MPKPYARIGSGARRAMWRELELMHTGTPEARAKRAYAEWEAECWGVTIEDPRDNTPLDSDASFDTLPILLSP